jgi:hypothetical protein
MPVATTTSAAMVNEEAVDLSKFLRLSRADGIWIFTLFALPPKAGAKVVAFVALVET